MGQNTRRDPRAKVLSMTVRYRSATLGEFIEHHSYDVSRGGMFIKTPSPFPAGTLLKFEVKIAEEQRVMQGVGRVVWKRDASHSSADEPAGMGIKFIKIDDGSRAVIERLLDSRGGGTLGAFDKSPEAERMFPETQQIDLPAPEDRTVIRPASELLEEALRKTGEEPGPSSAGAGSARGLVASSTASSGRGGFEPVKVATHNLASAPVPDLGNSDLPPPPSRIPSLDSLDRAPRSADLRPPSSAKAQAPSSIARSLEIEEESGGRTLFLFLAVAAVAVGIWVLTKRGGPPEAEPTPNPETLTAPRDEPPSSPIPPQATQSPADDPPTSGETGAGLVPSARVQEGEPVPGTAASVPKPETARPVPLLKKRKPAHAPGTGEPSGSVPSEDSTPPVAPTKPAPAPAPGSEPSVDNPY